MHDSILTSNPEMASKGLHMFVMKYIASHPEKELGYYFPIGHPVSPVLEAYTGKYSKQGDFLLFKDQSSCIVQEQRENTTNSAH